MNVRQFPEHFDAYAWSVIALLGCVVSVTTRNPIFIIITVSSVVIAGIKLYQMVVDRR